MSIGEPLPSAASLAGVRVLLLEDDLHYRPSVERILRDIGADVEAVGTVAEALLALRKSPHLVILDLSLPDGSGVEVVEAANRMRPAPRLIVASGSGNLTQMFRLGRMHVDQYLPKPYGVNELQKAVRDVRSPEQELADASSRAVGQMGLIRAREVVRASMVDQALELSEGNRTQAARMLGVTRQAVQSVVRND